MAYWKWPTLAIAKVVPAVESCRGCCTPGPLTFGGPAGVLYPWRRNGQHQPSPLGCPPGHGEWPVTARPRSAVHDMQQVPREV